MCLQLLKIQEKQRVHMCVCIHVCVYMYVCSCVCLYVCMCMCVSWFLFVFSFLLFFSLLVLAVTKPTKPIAVHFLSLNMRSVRQAARSEKPSKGGFQDGTLRLVCVPRGKRGRNQEVLGLDPFVPALSPVWPPY